jgi:hypothetical protein
MFSAEDAIDAMGTEDAEMISFRTAEKIADEHGACIIEFLNETQTDGNEIDAGELLIWLGY